MFHEELISCEKKKKIILANKTFQNYTEIKYATPNFVKNIVFFLEIEYVVPQNKILTQSFLITFIISHIDP